MKKTPVNFARVFFAFLASDLLLAFLVYALAVRWWGAGLAAIGIEAAFFEKALPAALAVLALLAGLGQMFLLRGLQGPAQPEPTRQSAEADSGSGPEKVTRFVSNDPGSALQLLALFQRKGRLVDFLQEDLSLYDDAQIGAAVRGVHEGCKSVLSEHVRLRPVLDSEEGSRVTVPEGFDPAEIQLTGHVRGRPPFRGTLRHRGWRIERIDLPLKTSVENVVIAQAEVEIGE